MTLKLIPADYGDCFLLNYTDAYGKSHNILIDGGLNRTYIKYLKPEIQKIQKRQEKLDLVVTTHIDQDHIEGILSFLSDETITKDLIISFWFNSKEAIKNYLDNNTKYHYTQEVEPKIQANSYKEKVSFVQGRQLEDFLNNLMSWKRKVILSTQKYSFSGVSITILSPSFEEIKRLYDKWPQEDRGKKNKASAKINDYDLSIEELSKKKFKEDSSITNSSSIAFILEFEDKRILFSGDAHATVIVNSLKKLGYSKDNKLQLEYLKLSHHGSKSNTSNEFLDLIKCNRFILSTNGNYCNLPHKETFARILTHPDRCENIEFFFNYRTLALAHIFKEYEKSIYKFECIMPINQIEV